MGKKKAIISVAVFAILAAAVGVYYFILMPEPQKVSNYYKPGDYFVTNIKDSTSLIKTTIVLEIYASPKDMDDIIAYLTENNHVIRDIIIFTLRSKTEEELRSQDIDETLRKEIVDRINEKMDIDYLSTVYFNDYVIQ